MNRDSITPEALRFERQLDAPVDKVWQYLVDPDLRATWFMGGPTDLKVDGEFGLAMKHDQLSDQNVPTPTDFEKYIGNSWSERITRCEPPHVLAITWNGGDAGEVTFELHENAGGTRLVLTHTGLRGRDDATGFGKGWHSHLGALQRRIAGKGVPNFWALHDEAAAVVEKALG